MKHARSMHTTIIFQSFNARIKPSIDTSFQCKLLSRAKIGREERVKNVISRSHFHEIRKSLDGDTYREFMFTGLVFSVDYPQRKNEHTSSTRTVACQNPQRFSTMIETSARRPRYERCTDGCRSTLCRRAASTVCTPR